MTQKIVFSIIIPVYNTSRYLPDCLGSILQQDFHSYEIICVDNNSTDNSLQILNDYSKEHSCIRILKASSRGAGYARNLALQVAAGMYICFVDSDDYVYPNLLSECYKETVNNPDVVIFGAKTLRANQIKSGQYSCKNFPKYFAAMQLFDFHTISCNKIYKKDFIKQNNIQFGTTKTGEDQIFTIKALLLAESIKVLKKDLYIYRRGRYGALTANRVKKDLSPITTVYEIENFLTENHIEYKLCEKILSRYLLKAISWYGKTDKEIADTYFSELAQMLEFVKLRNGRYWWDYFNLNRNCSYWDLKINYIKAFILYFWHEKLFIIPAGILFGVDTIADRLGNEKGQKNG